MLGKLEAEVMEILWGAGESSVHEVILRLERPLAYTTVMTTLDRLYKKGYLARRKHERAFRYESRFTREQWERKRLSEYFESEPARGEVLVSCLLEAVGQQDAALLEELERKIAEKRRQLARGGCE
jgi:predicted transcriptional regulator